MTNRDAGILTIRALAVYSLIQSLEQTAIIIRLWPENEEIIWPLFVYGQLFIPLLLLVTCAIVLWNIAPRLSNRIFESDNIIGQQPANLSDIKQLGTKKWELKRDLKKGKKGTDLFFILPLAFLAL
jgi:hypothetical protein